MTENTLQGKTVAFLVAGEGIEQVELTEPWKAVEQAGVRAVLCFETTDRDGEERARAGIAENVRFIRRCGDRGIARGRVGANFGMHACMTLSEDTLARCREAAPTDAGFHVHLAEHEYDEYRSMELAGTRSAESLAAPGGASSATISPRSLTSTRFPART